MAISEGKDHSIIPGLLHGERGIVELLSEMALSHRSIGGFGSNT